MTSAIEAALKNVRAAVGPKGVVDDAQEIERYVTETRGMYRGRAGLVVRPVSTAEVAEVAEKFEPWTDDRLVLDAAEPLDRNLRALRAYLFAGEPGQRQVAT